MSTALKKQSNCSQKTQATTEYQEPMRLSKAGQWRRDNPGGIFTVIDRKAVNRLKL